MHGWETRMLLKHYLERGVDVGGTGEKHLLYDVEYLHDVGVVS